MLKSSFLAVVSTQSINRYSWVEITGLPQLVGHHLKSLPQFPVECEKWPVPGSSGTPLARKPHLNTRSESHQGGRKSSDSVSSSCIDSWKKKSCEGQHSYCVTVYNFMKTSFHLLCRLVHSPVLRSLDKHYLQLGCT